VAAMTDRDRQRCALCANPHARWFTEVRQRHYHRCARCDLTFLDPRQRPSREEERAEYALHRNDPADPRYRRHLGRLLEPLTAPLPPGAEGLDFGCGPGPAVAAMLRERGLAVANYDPFFHPDPGVLERTYDVVVCTEVAEHFHHPGREFARLARLLRPGGRLGVMTRLLTPEIELAAWYYLRERSHVAFYSPATMAWLAGRFGWTLWQQLPDLTIFSRAADPDPTGRGR